MMKKQHISLLGNSQRLDGGAMFGHVPKALWSQWLPADENNLVELTCRCLLVKEQDRNILFETGVGAFFEPKLKQRYGIVEQQHVLLNSLAEHGLQHTDIDVVVLSHLHFDHAGGLLSTWADKKPMELLFPHAQFLVSKQAWQRACQPHLRDKASFIPQLNTMLKDSGRLHLVDADSHELLGEGFQFHFSQGHTPGLMLTEIESDIGPIVFAADLIPGAAWVHLPVAMGYDRCAEQLIDEKQQLLTGLVDRQGWLFFTHDPDWAIGKVTQEQVARFSLSDKQACLNNIYSQTT